MSGGKLFQSRVAAAANVLSPKYIRVRPATSVRVSAERNLLTPASVTSDGAYDHLPSAVCR